MSTDKQNLSVNLVTITCWWNLSCLDELAESKPFSPDYWGIFFSEISLYSWSDLFWEFYVIFELVCTRKESKVQIVKVTTSYGIHYMFYIGLSSNIQLTPGTLLKRYTDKTPSLKS